MFQRILHTSSQQELLCDEIEEQIFGRGFEMGNYIARHIVG